MTRANLSRAGAPYRRRAILLMALAAAPFGAISIRRAPATAPGAKPAPLSPAPEIEPQAEEDPPEVRLGERIFLDTRFSSRDSDKPFSCRTCHLVDEFVKTDAEAPDDTAKDAPDAAAEPEPDYLGSQTDPNFFTPDSPRDTMRAYVDYARRSPIPRRKEDPENTVELRNSPTMLDSDQMKTLHMDGEFPSLEALTVATLKGRNMGWLPGEEEKALDNAYNTLMTDKAQGPGAEGTYIQQFRATYQFDLLRSSRDEAINMLARAVRDYMRSLHTERDAPYDRFIKANDLPEGPEEGETPEALGRRLLDLTSDLKGAKKLQYVEGFGSKEERGMVIFFSHRTEMKQFPKDEYWLGSCVSCHTPPFFTDFSFHNTGVSQVEYDTVHGKGKFAKLKIPSGAGVKRPDPKFRAIPDKANPGQVDLGHWNFVNLKDSPLRSAGESDEALLKRTVATFKTPTLRDLKFTAPYFHNGSATTLKEAVTEYIHIGGTEPEVEIINRDPKLKDVSIGAKSVDSLVAFLNALNDNYE